MRFMIIVKATKDSETGVMPEETLIAEMAAYHEKLAKAGALLDASGLQPSSKGWRIKYSGGKRTVIDGPFAETKELIAGYTLIRVKSREEALEWTKRFPNPAMKEGEIEVRQLFELEDFGPSEAIERFRDMGVGSKWSVWETRGSLPFREFNPLVEESMIKTISLIAVGLVAALLIYAATKPDTFRVQRSVSIKAPPEKIFSILSDFHQSESWSPYEKKDPTMKRAISGAPSGKGAVYEFDGNNEVGKGRLTITDTAPPSKVVITLDMVEPFEAHSIVEYTLNTKDGSTLVTWAIHGPQPYVGKLMSVFIDCDKMIGKDFEVGLASLKAMTET